MTYAKRLAVTTAIFALISGTAYALPSAVGNKVQWDDPADMTNIAGYKLYWAKDAASRAYSDAQSVDVGLPGDTAIREVDVRTVTPIQNGSWCFVATAYDSQGRESEFSNEACGFFGIGAPVNVQVR